MKKLFLCTLVIFAGVILSNELSAQNPIPSFNVPVVSDPTIFEESNPSFNTNFNFSNYSFNLPNSRGEKKLRIALLNTNTSTTAWATIMVYSLDESNQYGPFTIYEDDLFEIAVSTSYLWGVRVIDASEDCFMNVWFD